MDADWNLRPQNINANGTFRNRLSITTPAPYPANASAGRIGVYSIESRNFELQQRVTADLHATICSSLGIVTLNEINSKHQFGTGSLSPLDLANELKAMFGTITKKEIASDYFRTPNSFPRFSRFLQQCPSQLRVPYFCRPHYSRIYSHSLFHAVH
jgi:hypothetical protein